VTHSFKPVTTEQSIQVAILDELQKITSLLEPSKEPVDMEPKSAPAEDVPSPDVPADDKPAAKKAPAKKASTRKRVTGQ
jgi:hypothetical protein